MRHILVLLIVISLIGCTKQWDATPWYVVDDSIEQKTMGVVETETERLGIHVTEFTKRGSTQTPILGISVSCQNLTAGARVVNTNPIQVRTSSQDTMEALPFEYALAKLGLNKKIFQQSQDLNPYYNPNPLATQSGAFLEAVARLITVFDRSSFGNGQADDEADIQLRRPFVRSSLASGASVAWTDYYRLSDSPVIVVVRRSGVEEQFSFTRPQPSIDNTPRYPLFAIMSGVAVSLVVILSS